VSLFKDFPQESSFRPRKIKGKVQGTANKGKTRSFNLGLFRHEGGELRGKGFEWRKEKKEPPEGKSWKKKQERMSGKMSRSTGHQKNREGLARTNRK